MPDNKGIALTSDLPVLQTLGELTLEELARQIRDTQLYLSQLTQQLQTNGTIILRDSQGRIIADEDGFHIFNVAGDQVVNVNTIQIDTSELADAAVATAKLADEAVTTTKIGLLAVGSAQIANAAIISAKIGDLQVVTAKIADLAVNNAKIANLAVDSAKINEVSVGKLSAGTIGANNIFLTSSRFHLDGVNEQIVIQDNQGTPETRVILGKLGAGAGDYGIEIYNSAGTLMFASNGTLNGAFIGNATIGTAAIQNAAITNALIANLAVDTAQIADAAIQTAKIGNLQISTSKIGNSQITTAKIKDLAVNTAKIDDLAVTTLKLGNQSVTIPSSGYTAGSLSVTNTESTAQSVTFTSSGAPVAVVATLRWDPPSDAETLSVRLHDGGNIQEVQEFSPSGSTAPFTITMSRSYTPGSGSTTLSFNVQTGTAGGGVVSERSLLALETKK